MNLRDLDNPEKIPTRNGYGDGVVAAGKKNKDVVVLCCDLTESTRSHKFREEFPDRFVEVGVAEQNMAGLAAGMALAGKIPYISSYAVFNPGINWSQIRVAICYSHANVKIMGAHAGISVGPDGATHQALEDIAITRVLPNMTVIVPCDYEQTKKAAEDIAEYDGPVYMRFARAATPVFTTEKTPFEIGKAQVLRDGEDVSIIACGPLVYEALMAARELEKDGISARVINNHTIKPMDEETIIAAARETGAIVTAEEHQKHGGMGSAVAETVSKNEPVPIEMVAMEDRFGESGEPDQLMEHFGLKSPNIIEKVHRVLERKRQDIKDAEGFAHPFYMGDQTISTLKELLLALENITDEEYGKHVTEHKNDFVNWVNNVFRDHALAEKLKTATSRAKAIKILKKEFGL